MKYYWRVFLWSNGAKSTEHTDYALAPIFVEDKLDETMDTGEVILYGMPIATKTAFPPKTKFRLERYKTENYTDTPDTWDMVVEHDDVQEYEGCPEICTHRIHLIEASAIAQGMHVDNIALTYELQDVTLNYRTIESYNGIAAVSGNTTKGSSSNARSYGGTWSNSVQQTTGYLIPKIENTSWYQVGSPGETYYEANFRYVWSNDSDLRNFVQRIDCHKIHHFDIAIPKLTAQIGTGSDWTNICELPVKLTVTCTEYKQMGRLDEYDRWVPDDEFQRLTVSTTNVASVTSYPRDTSSFKAIEGFTFIDGSYLKMYVPNPGTYYYTDVNRSPSYLTATFISISDTCPLSWSSSSMHQERVSFDTAFMSDGDSIETDSMGRTWVHWKEYTIKAQQAIYGAGGLQPVIRQRLKASCNWQSNHTTFEIRVTREHYETFYSSSNEYAAISAAFSVENMTITRSEAFLRKPQKYNALRLLRKALLTCDTRLVGASGVGIDTLEYPIFVNEGLAARLEATTIYETVFEQKNLWEVLVQIGYYLHAIPYLEFAEDGTDRYELKFRQLGSTEERADNSNKITVFNSINLSEYFTQYDSYVSNIFSPQNVVEEWIVPKTSSPTRLVQDDTAELQTKNTLSEIEAFKISYNGSKLTDAVEHIFEKSIYECLSVAPEVRPSKACALYYTLGGNKIEGLTYTPPEKNNGTAPTALKKLIMWVFGVSLEAVKNLSYNSLLFYIRYRTQDTARITHFRPDLDAYMKNCAAEQYPHHEQFYGQQDKIVDSERFSANLFGQLVRVGNAVYQRQEQAAPGNERQAGDLVMLGNEPYYVTETANEYYPDVVLQKVTYSKNFNQLSSIVTIPSEPRFYEVSERSTVRREVRLNDFFKLSSRQPATITSPTFLSGTWQSTIKKLVFNSGNQKLPNFAYTRFMSDMTRHNAATPPSIFPATKVRYDTDNNSYTPYDSTSYAESIVPLQRYPMKNSINFEWDMDDNFKVGDCVDTSTSGAYNTTGGSYYTIQAVRYCDIYGRADTFQFELFYKDNWTLTQAQRLPYAEIVRSNVTVKTPTDRAVALDKDNREALSFNYQINLLHDPEYVTYANLFGAKSGTIKACLLKQAVSMFEATEEISSRTAIVEGLTPTFTNLNGSLRISFSYSGDVSQVKAIMLYELDKNDKYPIMARNVSGNDKLASWYIYPIFQVKDG